MDDDLEDIPVADLDRANYVLGQIRRQRAIRDEEIALLRRERDRLDLLEQAAKERCARVEEWYVPQLESFHAAVLREDPKRKTIDLPNGALKARQGQPSWEFTDEFVEWASRAGWPVLRVRTDVDKAAAKQTFTVDDGKVLAPDGEVVPGVTVEPAVVNFSVTTP